ncbi:MAG: ribosomal RNA small subunit methyltransferase A [Candidatus Pacebacteria bacterium]|nr:ribosomal RNA small subunit methyltransferase A [Candidatus Paceibacterota bacterium]
MDKEDYQKLKSNKKIQAKKSLGQNFLHSKTALNKIISCSNLTNNDFVIEVGPGKGVLTEAILGAGAQVVAIEKDARLIELLNEKFESELESGQLKIILGDALTMEVIKKRKVFLVVDKDFTETGLRGDANIEKNIVEINKDYKIIANIPYYITGALLRIFYEQVVKPTSVTVLVQKEVADRIIARDSKESLLSLSIKFYGEPKKVMNVSKQSFKPAPRVDSAILFIQTHAKHLAKDSGKNTDLSVQGKFFDLIHRGFAHKRKVLRKNLIDSGLPNEIVDEAFAEIKIAPLSRAEDINFLTWIHLTDRLY